MARSYPGVGGAGAGGGGPGAGKMTRASQFSNFHIDTVGKPQPLLSFGDIFSIRQIFST